MNKKKYNLTYIGMAIIAIGLVAFFFKLISANSSLIDFVDSQSDTSITNVLTKNKSEIRRFMLLEPDCEKSCKTFNSSGIDRIIIGDGKDARTYTNENVYGDEYLSGFFSHTSAKFYEISYDYDGVPIKAYFPIKNLLASPVYSIYVGNSLVMGESTTGLVKIPGTNIRTSSFGSKIPNLLSGIIMSLIFFGLMLFGFISYRKENNALKLQIDDQTLSLTEANKELENERDVFADGPVIIIKWSSGWQWDVSYVSPNTPKIIGYGYADFMTDLHYDQIIHGDDIQRIRDDIEDAVKHNKTMIDHREFRIKKKDGGYIWVDSNTKMIQFDGEIQMLSYLVDVNDKMDAFRGLRNQRLAMDQATILSSTDLEGNITYVNDRFCDLCGFAREELIGKTYKMLNSGVHSSELFRNMWAEISQGKPWAGEICNKNKKDQKFWINMTIIPSLTEAGNVFEFQAISFEITEAKNDQERAIKQKAIADKANEAKSHFLANMSHELRTPMNGLMGMATLLHNTALSDQQIKFVDGILSSADHQLSILNNILDLSKMQSGHMDLEKIEFDLLDLLNNTITLFSPTANAKGIELGLIFANDVCMEYAGDKSRLKQIITNLINNAIKFTHWGRIIIKVSNLDKDLGIRIEVEDTGVGIAQGSQDKLFKKFSQVDETITRKFGGTGLGLSICKYITEAFGGTIGVESDLGAGSTFWVELPLEKVKSAKPTKIDPSVKVVISGNLTQTMDIYREIFNTHSVSYSITPSVADVFSSDFDERFDVLFIVCPKDKKEIDNIISIIEEHPDVIEKSIFSLDIETDPEIISNKKIRTVTRPATSWNVLESLDASINSRPIVKANRVSQEDGPGLFDKEHLSPGTKTLIVDDNKNNRDVLQMFISSLGGESDMARDGSEAVKMVEKAEYDIIFMDCHMPVMDGFQTIEKIRNMGIHTPIIMVTADITKETEERANEVGTDGFMLKPIDVDELKATLSKHTMIKSKPLADTEEDTESEPESEPETTLNLSSLNMMLDLDETSTRQIVGDIIKEYPSFSKSTKKLLKDEDYEKLERIIHKFKGGSLSFANHSILDIFADLNVYLQENTKYDKEYVATMTKSCLDNSKIYIKELAEYAK
jgi:PAS domain S-box-containing protein